MPDRIIDKKQYKEYLVRQQFKIISLILAVAGVLLFFFGYYLGISEKDSAWIEVLVPKNISDLRQGGALNSPVINVPQPDMPSPDETKFLDGKILEVSGGKVIFEVSGPSNLIGALKQYSLERTALITGATEILSFQPLKSQQEIRTTKKEDLIQIMGGYIKKTRLSISDLGTGDLISVVASEDISRQKLFEAIEIRLLKKSNIKN